MVPLDGLTRRDFAAVASVDVEIKTSKKNNVFEPGEELVIFVTNKSRQDIHVEFIGSSARGKKVILTPAVTLVGPGEQYRYPAEGVLKIQKGLGREEITLFASLKSFPPGVLLRGKGVADRVVHNFYKLQREGRQQRVVFDPAEMIKKTIEIETK